MSAKIDQLEVGKHMKVRSGDGMVKLDLHASMNSVGCWIGEVGGQIPKIGFYAESGKDAYFMIYPKGSTPGKSDLPVALSMQGVQIPNPNGGPPKILGWAKVFELVKDL